jgi:hypothetical protein
MFSLAGATLSLRAINFGFPPPLCTPAPTLIDHDECVTSNSARSRNHYVWVGEDVTPFRQHVFALIGLQAIQGEVWSDDALQFGLNE